MNIDNSSVSVNRISAPALQDAVPVKEAAKAPDPGILSVTETRGAGGVEIPGSELSRDDVLGKLMHKAFAADASALPDFSIIRQQAEER